MLTQRKLEQSEAYWLSLMANRQWYNQIAHKIIMYSPARDTVVYRGAYLIVDNKNVLGAIEKNENYGLDLINDDYWEPLFKRKINKENKQSRYIGFKDMFTHRPVIKDKVSVYLFGETATDPNDEGKEEGFVHWNACFVEHEDVMFFDPVLCIDDKRDIRILLDNYEDANRNIDDKKEYDFRSRPLIYEAIKETTGQYYHSCMTLPIQRTQTIVHFDRPDKDVFCQTWVLCFLDFYCHTKLIEFCKISFASYRTDLIKHWIYSRLRRFYDIEKNKEWLLLENDDEIKFLYYPYIMNRGVFEVHKTLLDADVLRAYNTTDNCPDFILQVCKTGQRRRDDKPIRFCKAHYHDRW